MLSMSGLVDLQCNFQYWLNDFIRIRSGWLILKYQVRIPDSLNIRCD